ncbi:MAG: endo alpha-1,4 polygalactosaminidase, partial [Methyloversatilis sp.]|nr:endo alpha-1,4 polygalactosaminidase [Methyloversatilis sp.]
MLSTFRSLHRLTLSRFTCLLCLAALALFAVAASAQAGDLPSVALHYGADAPLTAMKAFDIAVVEPDHGFDPVAYRGQGRSELFAYVSVGEVHPSRPYAARIPETWRIGRNSAWKSIVIDQAQSAWPAFFAEQVIAPLWSRGYRGFFLDTLDSYHLVHGVDVVAQQQGMVAVVRQLRSRFPGIRLIFNRGFELLPDLRGEVYAVAAESLYRGWDEKKKRYVEVGQADRDWLLGQL